MKHRKQLFIFTVIATFLSITMSYVYAEEKATPQEVYQLILKAVPVLETLGEKGLDAFKQEKGEFVFKDTYVLVTDCKKMVLVAHPNNKLIGMDVSNHLDKNPDPAKQKNQDKELCEAGKKPNGGWVEYYWEKLSGGEPARKISFALQVPKTDYTVIAGIYDDKTSVDELNKMVK